MAEYQVAKIHIWGHLVGAVAWNPSRNIGEFEFDPAFVKLGLDLAPLQMPINRTGQIFSFPGLNRETYYGLPGMLADALPDRWGNQLIDRWLAERGRSREDFGPVERLCYMGKRATGALEFEPVLSGARDRSVKVEIEHLVELAKEIIKHRSDLSVKLSDGKTSAIREILRVGTSAGGARAKAVLAINPSTGEIRSGQINAGDGFEYWIIKLDGVTNQELGDPKEYGKIEYAYYLMAKAAGIEMTECKLMHEGDRAHFMTRRFDRLPNCRKLHLQSLCAIAHYDYNAPRSYSYEQAFQVMDKLHLDYRQKEELFRRAVFNVMGRNQDDHTKNISFLMDETGTWKLSPAYDLIYSHHPGNRWTDSHQMTINGKADDFSRADMFALAERAGLKNSEKVIKQVRVALDSWPEFAKEAELSKDKTSKIRNAFRTL
jgi:serine/threonine-protein kinase HipA